MMVATKLGGHSWERAGSIWYDALRKHLKSNSDFADAAQATVKSAVSLYGEGKDEEKAVREAWQEVGVL